jgi:hypothetical protein
MIQLNKVKLMVFLSRALRVSTSCKDSLFVTERRCVFLIENVGSVQQIKDLLPVTPRNCLVIVTSRKNLPIEVEIENALPIHLSGIN